MKFQTQIDFFKCHTVINWHEHVWMDENNELDEIACDMLARHAKLVNMNKVVISLPSTKHISPEKMEHSNNIVASAVDKYPELFRGLAFIDPVHGKNAVIEIERCIIKLGMIGIKLYHQYKMDDPMQYPIIERCIELDIPILMHAGKLSENIMHIQPNIADSTQFVNISRRYPEATFIMAHIGGGGDWHWQLKGMENCKNVYTDTSGSVFDSSLIEETVKVMGSDRILFGTDGSFSAGIGKLLSANISDSDKITIMNNPNFNRFLERGCK